ncbi:MAG: FAD-binding oxidoreductase [Oscillochloris sp.]|nr:FAD-binding oxidoreductase [Oscillochloris sp.]
MVVSSADVVICGAGIAGLAAAAELARADIGKIVIVERGDPLALTSDKSTECYRNWWPGPDAAMVQLMNRSIDRLEQLDSANPGRIRLNRRGYLYASADQAQIPLLLESGRTATLQGAGPLRVHGDLAAATPAERAPTGSYRPAAAHNWRDQPAGADLIVDPALLREQFPFLNEQTVVALHARRCGWFSGQQFGMLLLEAARAAGAILLRGELTAIEQRGGKVSSVEVAGAEGSITIATPLLINAAGPLAGACAGLMGIELPLINELHLKAAIADPLMVVPREGPMLIWNDSITLDWDADERAALRDDPDLHWLAERMPAGAHCRPEGEGTSTQVLMLWDYHSEPAPLIIPPPLDDTFPEIVLRGMAHMLPGLRPYLERVPRAYLDGGYYTKTPENRPLIGPLPVEGAYIIGAFSGFGLMAAPAAAELLAAHILGRALPSYAAAFHPQRYADPAYAARIAAWGASGQL